MTSPGQTNADTPGKQVCAPEVSKLVKNSSKAFVAGGAVAGALVGFLILLPSGYRMPYPQLFIIQRVPLALVIGAFVGGAVGGTIFLVGLRNLELICGVATVVVAIFLSLFVLKFDWDASLVVAQQFALRRELSLALLLFMFPGMLVSVGSYAHAAKRREWGRWVLGVGCMMMMWDVLLLRVILPLAQTNWFTILNLSFPLLAILALVLSLIADNE